MSELVSGATSAKVFSETLEEELVETGVYEVILECEPKEYGESKDKLGLLCKFRIRRDVNQPTGRPVFDTIWLDKDQVEWKGWFDHRKLHKILLTQTAEKPKLNFNSPEECIQFINGLPMRVTIEKTFDDYRGKYINKIAYLSYEKSTAAPVLNKDLFSQPSVGQPSGTPISDDELPF